ncbi:hypothetical protein GGE16_002319 [Rhizobium leguminosarum]|uniref:Uncharacterized protein n=2 Tax=Rhizobium/Agrobacterium group TaxID=227290 RepID=A0AAE2SX87_RHILE|nr:MULTISPECIES: hypothetical protein [Rhizobium]MBB4290279.1 hypothetical protein [Rhizobium leguminosarum]MBB4528975.1 hypothetical protein [Rhizobium leguminosarum]MDF9819583.1 hypothetical protein [Rhizobium leguminosarum]
MGWKIFAICSAISCIWGIFDCVAGNDPLGVVDAIALLFWLCGTAVVGFYAFDIVVLDLRILNLFFVLFSIFVLVQISCALWVALPLIGQARSNAYAAGVMISFFAILALDGLNWVAIRRYSRGYTLRGLAEF